MHACVDGCKHIFSSLPVNTCAMQLCFICRNMHRSEDRHIRLCPAFRPSVCFCVHRSLSTCRKCRGSRYFNPVGAHPSGRTLPACLHAYTCRHSHMHARTRTRARARARTHVLTRPCCVHADVFHVAQDCMRYVHPLYLSRFINYT